MKLTIQQMNHYFDEAISHRKRMRSAEENLAFLCTMMASWFGIKLPRLDGDQPKSLPLELETDFPTAKLTEKEINAWIAADMPTLKVWLPRWRATHG